MEPRLHQRLQIHGHHRLRDPVGDRGHAEHTDPAAMRLGDLHRPDRGRKVGPRAHPIPDPVEVVLQIGLELVQRLPIHSRGTLVGLDLPLRLPDQLLGNRERLVLGLWHVHPRFLPGLTPRLNEMDIPGEPAPSLHPHPSEQGLHSYYGPVRQRAPHRYSMPSVSASARSLSRPWGLRPRTPFRRSPSHVPCKSRRPGSRRLYAGHHLAKYTGTRQAHLEGKLRTPDFDANSNLITTPQQRTPDRALPDRALLERLPGPHLTRSRRAFSLVAHHDGLQPTQHQGGLAPAPAGRRWRANKPPSLAQHRLWMKSSTRLLLQRS